MHVARNRVARARAIRNGFREERRLTRACRGLEFRDGTRSRRCSRSHGVVPPITAAYCRTTNNKDSTHNVQGRARGISHSRRVCKAARIRRTWYAIRAPVLAAIRPIYFSQGDHSITTIPRNCELRVYMCTYARAATAPAYVMTAITCTAFALWNAVRNAFDYVYQGRRYMTAAIDVTL